jgi:hypothetical protein
MDWAAFGVEPISMIGVDAKRLFQKHASPGGEFSRSVLF